MSGSVPGDSKINMTALVYKSSNEYLARHPVRNRRDLLQHANALIGRFHSGSPDIAINHDQYLDDACDSCSAPIDCGYNPD